MIKTFEDGGRWLLTIEPVGDEERELIKQIKVLCGIENEKPKTLNGLVPPEIPKTETTVEQKTNKYSDVGPGYQKYLATVKKIRNKELTGDEKAKAVESVKKMAEIMKTKVPKGANLRFCIENMSEMFSQRIEDAVLDKMHISKEQLVLGDENLMTEAYQLAVTV